MSDPFHKDHLDQLIAHGQEIPFWMCPVCGVPWMSHAYPFCVPHSIEAARKEYVAGRKDIDWFETAVHHILKREDAR